MIRDRQGALERRDFAAIAVLWAVITLGYVVVRYDAIVHLRMPDGDDYLRLQQVRDWLAGQGWFDVSQHRVNPPQGVAMHWSRLVDLPIALVIIALRPVVGQANAEIAAGVLIPMATLALIMVLAAATTARVVARTWAVAAAGIVTLSAAIYLQVQPLRIDHHGWQIVAALVLLWAASDEARQWRSGVIAGVAGALWLTISVEGLPVVAAAGLVLAGRWLLDPTAAPRLQAYVWALTIASIVFEVTTSGLAWTHTECDELSRPYVLVFLFASVGVSLFGLSMMRTDWRMRAGAGLLIGLVSGSAFVWAGRSCLAGPFSALEPLVRTLWLNNVAESLPLWRHGLGPFFADGSFAAVGCVGAAWAFVTERDRQARLRWCTVLVLGVIATALMMVLTRAGGVAHAYAIPGIVYVVRALKARAENGRDVYARAAAFSAIVGMLILPGAALLLDKQSSADAQARPCDLNLATIDRLPAGVIFAPLDVGPELVVRTRHSVVATAHHRNHAAMNDVLSAFTGSTQAARTKIMAHGAQYVAFCPTASDSASYIHFAPHGFAAELAAGRAPYWLRPIPDTLKKGELQVYLVRTSAH